MAEEQAEQQAIQELNADATELLQPPRLKFSIYRLRRAAPEQPLTLELVKKVRLNAPGNDQKWFPKLQRWLNNRDIHAVPYDFHYTPVLLGMDSQTVYNQTVLLAVTPPGLVGEAREAANARVKQEGAARGLETMNITHRQIMSRTALDDIAQYLHEVLGTGIIGKLEGQEVHGWN